MDQDEFNEALQCLGFTAAIRIALNNQGLTTLQSLLYYQKDQIKRICKIIRNHDENVDAQDINMLKEQWLITLRNWTLKRQKMNLPLDADLIPLNLIQAEAMKMINELEEAEREKNQSDPKLPDKFEAKTKWSVWQDAFMNYLSQVKGASGAPLAYVLQQQIIPDPAAVFAMDTEELIARAPLVGDVFNRDNETVYATLKNLILEGPAYDFITPRIDSRKDGEELCKRSATFMKDKLTWTTKKKKLIMLSAKLITSGN